MSSLVVLRSWSDGQPPVVRAIAKDTDKGEVEIKPDRQGQFVTEQIPKTESDFKKLKDNEDFSKIKSTKQNNNENTKNNDHNNFNKFGQFSQLKFWKQKDKYNCSSPSSTSSSITNSSSSPSPPFARPRRSFSRTGSIDSYYDTGNESGGGGGGGNQFEKISLSRESSIPSLANSPIDGPGSSPPSSPSIQSRYKHLGPELAATIPKRQIIRKSWIRDDVGPNSSLVRKKEMSKSTPSLNSIIGLYSSPSSSSSFFPSSHHQQQQSHQAPLLQQRNHASSVRDFVNDDELSCVVEEEPNTTTSNAAGIEQHGTHGGGLLLTRSTSSTLNCHSHHNQNTNNRRRPLSYIDSIFVDKEPTFGDVPASVVGVIKKEQVSRSVSDANVKNEISKDSKNEEQQQVKAIDSDPNQSVKPKIIARQKSSSKLQSSSSPLPSQVKLVAEEKLNNSLVIKLEKTTKPIIVCESKINQEENDENEFKVHNVVHSQSVDNLDETKALKEEDDDESELQALVEPEEVITEGGQEILDSGSVVNIDLLGNIIHPQHNETKSKIIELNKINEDNNNKLNTNNTTNNNNNMMLSGIYARSNKERLLCCGGGGSSSGTKVGNNEKKSSSSSLSPSSNDDDNDLSSMIMFSQHANQKKTKHSSKVISHDNNNINIVTQNPDGDDDDDAESFHTRNNNGIAYAQVPNQCVNQHVMIPESYNHHVIKNKLKQLQARDFDYEHNFMPKNITTNNASNYHSQIANNQMQKNVQSRKNFCDELLNDNIVLRVPLRSPSPTEGGGPKAPSMTPPPVPPSVLPTSPTSLTYSTNSSNRSSSTTTATVGSNLNHDGIIFFDEEDEFDHCSETVSSEQDDTDTLTETENDENRSMAVSEKENLFEYMSVCHNNVKSNSPDQSLSHQSCTTINKPSPPEFQKRYGIDLGSSHVRFCVLDSNITSTHSGVQIQDISRAMITSDGLAHGYKSIPHSMSTKSKLIYKWRPTIISSNSSSSPSSLANKPTSLLFDDLYSGDSYNEEDFSQILETLFKHYAQMLNSGSNRGLMNGTMELIHNNLNHNINKSNSPSPSSSPVPSTSAQTRSQWNLSIISGMDKKLVREAAYNTGLVKPIDELRLINESTAAAVTAYEYLKSTSKINTSSSHYHHHLHHHRRKKIGKTFLSLTIGSTFIHSSGYELMKEDGKLQIISPATSHLYQSPESQFISLLSRIFSSEFILKYESRFTPAWIELLLRFDEMKTAYFTSDSKPYLFLPISFYIEFYKCTGMQIPECLEDNIEEGVSWDNNGALKFNKQLLHEWCTAPLLSFIKTRLDKSYDNIVLSGGGAGVYDYILQDFEKELPNVNIYKIPNPENAVVYGLVNLDNIKISFKSPFSIGVGVMTPFDEKIHPKEKCVTRNKKQWCSDVWDNLIRKGQILTVGEVILKRTYVGAQPGQSVLVLPIFKSYSDEPKLVTSPSVEKCCELRFEIGKDKSWREVQLIIKCYESELAVIASGTDGIISQVPIDF